MDSILRADVEPAIDDMIYVLRDARSRFLDAEYTEALALLGALAERLLLVHAAVAIVGVKAKLPA